MAKLSCAPADATSVSYADCARARPATTSPASASSQPSGQSASSSQESRAAASPRGVDVPDDPSTWVVGFHGVGPVALGAPFSEERAGLPGFADVTDPICTSSYLDLQLPNGQTIIIMRSGGGGEAVAGIQFGSRGAPGELSPESGPRTEAGIGSGSTLTEMQAAYPGLQKTGDYGTTTYYGITDGDGAWIVFRAYDGLVVDIQVANERDLPAENGSAKIMPHERCPA